ncbi:FadR/GntR family transcriptional regulator [Actinophytocola sp.]|uniref:FadR/GntR family transcriptional regulator n=1 Tax=Actinophytocola sp. TaxID=1872138 RepID=UPI0025BCB34D|nr:FCD domain-containing protein [Actinophytocola sp.]
MSRADRPQKTATLLARRIVREIFEQKLDIGDPLESEREMLQHYDVGRGTLREALRHLELEGVLRIRPGRGGGPIVDAPSSRHLASTLALLLQFEGATFGSVLETRKHLEPLTARLAAERVTPELRRELEESVVRMDSLLGDADAFLLENRAFHGCVAWGGRNPIVGFFINSLHWITDGSVLGAQYPTRFQKAINLAHRNITEAIVAGDADGAWEAMGAHMDETATYFKKKYPELVNRELTWDLVDK